MTQLGPYGDTHGSSPSPPKVKSGPALEHHPGIRRPPLHRLAPRRGEHTLCVNEQRVYVTGLSDGAFMTSAVACEYANRVAAVAPVAGIQDIAGCRPARPVPVVTFHGTADPFVAFNGGLGAMALQLPAPDGSNRTLGQSGAATNTTGHRSPRSPRRGRSATGAPRTPRRAPWRATSRPSAIAAPSRRRRLLPHRGGRTLLAGQPVLALDRLGDRATTFSDLRRHHHLAVLPGPPAPLRRKRRPRRAPSAERRDSRRGPADVCGAPGPGRDPLRWCPVPARGYRLGGPTGFPAAPASTGSLGATRPV